MISPAEFIPLAEETGLILPLGEWVLRTACTQAARWPQPVGVAVNLSAMQFKGRNLVQLTLNALAASGLAAGPARSRDHRVGAAAGRGQHAQHPASACARSACRSRWTISAPAIRRWPICGTSRSTRSRSIARSCATCWCARTARPSSAPWSGLARSLGITTIIEGIETKEQLDDRQGRRLRRGPGLAVRQGDARARDRRLSSPSASGSPPRPDRAACPSDALTSCWSVDLCRTGSHFGIAKVAAAHPLPQGDRHGLRQGPQGISRRRHEGGLPHGAGLSLGLLRENPGRLARREEQGRQPHPHPQDRAGRVLDRAVRA